MTVGLLTGAEALTEVLALRGCSTVYAYPGTSEMALCAAIERKGDLNLFNARGDKEAVFMAAGGNRLGRPRCAAILHGARGLTNALGAVADVRRSEVPVLCMVGMPSRSSERYLPPHGEAALIQAGASFARASFDCSTMEAFDPAAFVKLAAEAVHALDEAPAGPVLLGLPQDLLSQRFVPAGSLTDLPARSAVRGGPEITEAVAAIRGADRPVILVDDYLLRSPASERDLAAFATPLAAPVLQVSYRRGPMLFQQARAETVPTYVGPYDATDRQHRDVLGTADLLITLEDRNMYPRVVGHLPACRKLALTSNVAATVKNGYLQSSDVLVAGDVPRLLRQITRRLRTSGDPESRVRPAVAAREHGQPLPTSERRSACSESATELVRAVARGLIGVRRPVIVDDSQMFGGLIARNYGYLPASVRVFGSHGGFVGGGLATAVGLAEANPSGSVLVTLGDQGFTNGVQALAAASERAVPLVMLVCNNGASVSLRLQTASDEAGAADAVLGNVDRMGYAAIARGFGLTASEHAWPDGLAGSRTVVAASRELSDAIRHAFATRRPHLVEVRTPDRLDFWAGIWRVNGLDDA